MPDAPNLPIRSPLLYGGISNQPHDIRFQNQVQDAQNFVFSVVDGASKRPGSQHIADASSLLPDSGVSGASTSTAPAAPGTAPATCAPGDHASSYTVTFSITGTDPDGTAISHIGETAVAAQHSGLCLWSVIGTKQSSLTPHILIQLDTADKQFEMTFLMVPDTTQPIALFGNTVMAGGTQTDPDTGTWADTGNFGDSSTTYLLDITTISVA